MKLAVRVAAEVVGLTNSRIPGMDRRLSSFFTHYEPDQKRALTGLLHAARSQAQIASFFYLDVKPAIDARWRRPKADVISHLLAQRYTEPEILTECITYAAAGMATTREFISVAAWHLLEQPQECEYYRASDEDTRLQLLQELLRLEPVVGHLYRRTTAALDLRYEGASVTIPQGSLIDLHIYAINADEMLVGDNPLLLCPQRSLKGDRVGPAVMSFGDGPHRCPGAYIALQETDIFLRRLLAVSGLSIVQKPSVAWNELTKGYELRNFLVGVKG